MKYVIMYLIPECLSGQFGENCSQWCGQCKDRARCDPQNGWCLSGCQPGTEGYFCQYSE